MKNFHFSFCITLLFFYANQAIGSEAGMPQLNPEFWPSQIFWLILIFSILYIIIWKIFLPKIVYSVENRKSRIVNDLHETQQLKENAEKKLNEYNQIIKNSKIEAKKIIEDNKKKLDQDIEIKKQKFNKEIEDELSEVEKEIKDLKKSSLLNINNIAADISAEIIREIIDSEVNKSNVSAIVNDISKRKVEQYL